MFNIFRKIGTEWYQEKHMRCTMCKLFCLTAKCSDSNSSTTSSLLLFIALDSLCTGFLPNCVFSHLEKKKIPMPVLQITFCLRNSTEFCGITSA